MTPLETAQNDLIQALEAKIATLTALAEIRKSLLELRNERLHKFEKVLWQLAETNEIARQVLSNK